MGEFSASDCSWKKMVIAKANDQWTTKVKTEQNEVDGAGDTTGFSLDEAPEAYGGVKREREEVNTEHIYDNVHTVGEMNALVHDPLFIDEPSKRRRRKGSGPKNESSDERAARLAKMSAYAAQRLANESPEQRAVRLKRMSEYAAKRLAQETSEQRAKRLARMSAYAAKRLAKESPEERQARLARMSAYAARRHALKKFGSSPDGLNSPFNHEITDQMSDQS